MSCFAGHLTTTTPKPFELQRLAHQARMHGAHLLVTTEKDRINCPNHLAKAIAPLNLAWLEIDLELEDEAHFFEGLGRVLRKRRPDHRMKTNA